MADTKIDLSKYENHLGRKHQLIRLLLGIIWALCASWLPRSVAKGWKNFLLRLFGAKIAKTAHVYSSAKVYYPPFLTMGEYSCLASDVECYNVAPIAIGANTTVSQGAVVGATASVYKDVEAWTIVGGNPAKFIKNRVVK